MTINNYATLNEVKTAIPDNSLTTTADYDPLAIALISNVSRAIDKYTNRKPGAYYVNADVIRYIDGPAYGMYSPIYGIKTQRLSGGYTGAEKLRIGELAALPSEVAVAETAAVATAGGAGTYTVWPTTDYWAEPSNAADDGIPYTTLVLDILSGTHRVWYPWKRAVRITGKFGYSTSVPSDVKEAVILQIIRLIRKAQQNYMNVATILDAGQVMQGDRLDQDITMMIKHYRRQAV